MAASTWYTIREKGESGRTRTIGYLELTQDYCNQKADITLQTQAGTYHLVISHERASRGTYFERMSGAEHPYQKITIKVVSKTLMKAERKIQAENKFNFFEHLANERNGYMDIEAGRGIDISEKSSNREFAHTLDHFGIVETRKKFLLHAPSRIPFEALFYRPTKQMNTLAQMSVSFDVVENADYEVIFADKIIETLNSVYEIKCQNLQFRRDLFARGYHLRCQLSSDITSVIKLTEVLMVMPLPSKGMSELHDLTFSLTEETRFDRDVPPPVDRDVLPPDSPRAGNGEASDNISFLTGKMRGVRITPIHSVQQLSQENGRKKERSREHLLSHEAVDAPHQADSFAASLYGPPLHLDEFRLPEESKVVQQEGVSYWGLYGVSLPDTPSDYIDYMIMAKKSEGFVIRGIMKLYNKKYDEAKKIWNDKNKTYTSSSMEEQLLVSNPQPQDFNNDMLLSKEGRHAESAETMSVPWNIYSHHLKAIFEEASPSNDSDQSGWVKVQRRRK